MSRLFPSSKVEHPLEAPEPAPVWPIIDSAVKGLVYVLVAYWGLLALLTPVTVTDSQVYNLGRLPIAERYGLFGDHLFTSSRQIAFPWSFDAIHLGFLKLGFGYALPSFFCLIGILIVSFRLAREWAGRTAAWWVVLILLSMPTIEFQATSTKNDLGVVFALAAGFYALWRFTETRNVRWLAIVALAAGFLPGIKDAGFVAAAGLLSVALWELRRAPRRLAFVLAGTVASAVLFGSAEIYFNNWLSYGHLLGPADLVAAHSNRDGVRGALANLIRYLFGMVNLARTPPHGDPAYVPGLEHACRSVLHAVGLRNVGYHPAYNDANFRIAREAGETTSDFALIGFLLVPLALWQVVRRPWKSPARWLAIGGFLYLGAMSYTVAWMPWNMRFLMPCFVFFALAFVIGEQRWLAGSRIVRAGLLAVSAYSAIIPTWFSFNKQPERDLVDAVTQRDWETYLELWPMNAIVHASRDWLVAHPHGHLLLLASGNSWVLPIFTNGFNRVDVLAGPHLAPADMPTPSTPVAVLSLDRDDFDPAAAGAPLKLLQKFELSGSALYEVVPRAQRVPISAAKNPSA